MERSNKEMKRYRRGPEEGSRAKREKEVERMRREGGVNGNGRVMGMKEAKQRNEDVTAGYQRRTTKVIKLGWKGRLGQIGRPFNWEFDEFMDFLICHYGRPFRDSLSRLCRVVYSFYIGGSRVSNFMGISEIVT